MISDNYNMTCIVYFTFYITEGQHIDERYYSFIFIDMPFNVRDKSMFTLICKNQIREYLLNHPFTYGEEKIYFTHDEVMSMNIKIVDANEFAFATGGISMVHGEEIKVQ